MGRKRLRPTARRITLRKDLRKYFRKNPNELFTVKELRKVFNGLYNDTEYYVSMKELFDDGIINRRIIFHQSYYWLVRR